MIKIKKNIKKIIIKGKILEKVDKEEVAEVLKAEIVDVPFVLIPPKINRRKEYNDRKRLEELKTLLDSLDGIGFSKNRKEFEEILGPVKGGRWDDRPFSCRLVKGQYITTGVSTCGLVCRGIWRKMLIDFDDIYKPYVFGEAINKDIAFGKKVKAWQKVEDVDMMPSFGDYVVIGEGLRTQALTCYGWDGDYMISIDGGQVDSKGKQCIKKIKRLWSVKNKDLFLGDRKVVGWVVFDLLPYKNSASK